VEQAASELDRSKRQQLYRQAEEIMVSDYAAVFLFHPVNLELRKPHVKGYSRQAGGMASLLDYTRIYIGT
jgi:ABC-type transport system substrate-binding protein